MIEASSHVGPTIIVGLGNPGENYTRTRHNAGFWCMRRLAKEHSVPISRQSRIATIGEGILAGKSVVLAMPRTYVNASGEAVRYLIDHYKASANDLVVIYDDMDLAPGRIRVRKGGGAGGHNGMKSIVQSLGTQEFGRLRIGIGRPTMGTSDIDHVLGEPPTQDLDAVSQGVDIAAKAIKCLLENGYEVAMNHYNTR